jgi:hypothetical protein
MADPLWLTLIAAALGGGIAVKIFDIGYQEFRQRSVKNAKGKNGC